MREGEGKKDAGEGPEKRAGGKIGDVHKNGKNEEIDKKPDEAGENFGAENETEAEIVCGFLAGTAARVMIKNRKKGRRELQKQNYKHRQ